MEAIQQIQERSGLMFGEFLAELPDTFTTLQAKQIGNEYGVSVPTVHNWLKTMRREGLIVKVRFGEYCKV
jgi:predicted transcriptional regulator